MREGDVVLAMLAQADGQNKRRPALLLRFVPPFYDALLCGISSRLAQATVNFDEIVLQDDLDFADSGLDSVSVIRLGYIAAIPQSQIIGRIGRISQSRHQRLLQNLSRHLLADSNV
jgi:mRNA interferase MazF